MMAVPVGDASHPMRARFANNVETPPFGGPDTDQWSLCGFGCTPVLPSPSPLHTDRLSSRDDTKVITRGTHRIRSCAQTWQWIRPFHRALGITRVANVTGLDDVGIPVVMVYRPNAPTLAVCQGKGLTEEAARVSGVMEAVEVFHAEEAQVPTLFASRSGISRHGVPVDVDALRSRTQVPVEADREIAWVAGQDLVSGDRRWIPYECVQLTCVDSGRRLFPITSSGLGCGNSLEEAISHAICEVVERHALAIWESLPVGLQSATAVDLASIEDADCQWLLKRCHAAGAAVAVWNMTSEIGISAFACCIAQQTFRHPRIIQPGAGFGCHPNRNIALVRALTEAAQSRLTRIAGSRDDLTECLDQDRSQIKRVQRAVDFIDAGAAADFPDTPSCHSRDVGGDVKWALEQLSKASVREVVVVDLTRRDFGIPVVRVTIPGLGVAGVRGARGKGAR
jgi:YcaO-like protein with predicted kinase domain